MYPIVSRWLGYLEATDGMPSAIAGDVAGSVDKRPGVRDPGVRGVGAELVVVQGEHQTAGHLHRRRLDLHRTGTCADRLHGSPGAPRQGDASTPPGPARRCINPGAAPILATQAFTTRAVTQCNGTERGTPESREAVSLVYFGCVKSKGLQKFVVLLLKLHWNFSVSECCMLVTIFQSDFTVLHNYQSVQLRVQQSQERQ